MSNYQSYMAASDRVVDLIVRSVAEDGEFIGDGFTGDLVAIYKAPSLLLLGGRPDVASRLLNYIKRRYGQEDGDFLSNPEKSGNERRTYNPVVREYAAYMGGWVMMAAQRLGRFEISFPAFDCVQSYWSPTARSFIPDQPYNKSREQEVETVITSHLGLISLYFHDLEKARGAADALVHIAHQQTELDTRFVLRMWESTGKLITEKKSADSLDQMYFVYRDRKDEFFFMLGYPAIFLAKFYLATAEAKYLDSARNYLDFLLTCDQSLYSFYLSHKVAYGAAIVGRITKEQKYITLATKIADYLVSEQDKDGVFCAQRMSGKDDQYDQAAEIGIWLREVYTELTLTS